MWILYDLMIFFGGKPMNIIVKICRTWSKHGSLRPPTTARSCKAKLQAVMLQLAKCSAGSFCGLGRKRFRWPAGPLRNLNSVKVYLEDRDGSWPQICWPAQKTHPKNACRIGRSFFRLSSDFFLCHRMLNHFGYVRMIDDGSFGLVVMFWAVDTIAGVVDTFAMWSCWWI